MASAANLKSQQGLSSQALDKVNSGPPPEPSGPQSVRSLATASSAANSGPASDTGQPKELNYAGVVDFSKSFKTNNLQANLLGMSAKGKEFKKKTEALLAAGDTEGLKAHFATVEGKAAYKPYTDAIMGQVGEVGGGQEEGSRNPFTTPEGVDERYGPALEQAFEQGITEADQALESEQEIRQHTGDLYEDIGQRTNDADARIEGIQTTAGEQHAQFTAERKGLTASALAIPDQVSGKFDQAMDQFLGTAGNVAAMVDAKEAAALGGVMEGRSMAMQAAVQGIQGNVNNQIAQIEANPDLTASQKQTMKAQLRLQGVGQMAPAVGQTILQFNQLAAQTATAFGQMATQVGMGTMSGVQSIGQSGAQAFAESSVAANQIAQGLLASQQNADQSFISNMTNLEGVRATIDQAGDTLRASLLPAMGKPYARYRDVMMDDLQMDIDLQTRSAQVAATLYNIEVNAWMAAQMVKQGAGNVWSTIGQSIPGPAGQLLTAAGTAYSTSGNNNAPMPKFLGY